MLYTLFIVVTLFSNSCSSFQNGVTPTSSAVAEKVLIKEVINNYHYGFIKENYETVRSSISDYLSMHNGNYSGDPVQWQPHQFIHGEEIDEWIRWMLANVRPFTNEVTYDTISFRNNAAIVVTTETGTNGYRKWENEQVTYYLGKIDNVWRLTGFFMKDMKNPE